MSGIDSAAPVLFDLFNRLPTTNWFAQPYDHMLEVQVCGQSGYLATALCTQTTQWIPAAGNRFEPCPYHERINLDQSSTTQVTADCEPIPSMRPTPWFTLPPIMSYYYTRSHTSYASSPFFTEDYTPAAAIMQFIRPKPSTTVTATKNISGMANDAIFELAQRNPTKTVFWYV